MTNHDTRFTPGTRVRVTQDMFSPENIGAIGSVTYNDPFGPSDPYPIGVRFDEPVDRLISPTKDVFHPTELEILS